MLPCLQGYKDGICWFFLHVGCNVGSDFTGGSRGMCWAHAPPMGPNSFIFAKQCPHRGSMPPMGNPVSTTGFKYCTLFEVNLTSQSKRINAQILFQLGGICLCNSLKD